MSGESPTNKEKERISKPAHAACTQVLAMLLGHETLQSPSLSTAARSALLDGTYANIDAVEPADLKAKLTRKTMGLDVVQKLLGSKPSRCRFKTCERFSKDVRLVFQNILLYQSYLKDHAPKVYDPTLFETSQRLLQGFEMMYAGELARHVTTLAAQPSPSVSPEPSPAAPSSHKPPSTTLSHRPSSSSSLSDDDKAKCHGIVQRIMKYKEMGVAMAAPFFNPVDVGMYVDYKVKIPHRMHLYGVQQKLSTGAYASAAAFVQDMRLIFANCLVYNSEVILSAKIREHAVKLMHVLEQLVEQASFDQTPNATWTGMAHTDRWKCHQVLQDVLAHRSPGGIETAQWFKHPIVTYFASPDQAPFNYFKVIKRPMDIGTVTSRLHLGEYGDVAAFVADLRLVFDNCIKYWKASVDGQVYCDAAKTLLATMESSAVKVFGSAMSASLFPAKTASHEKRTTSATATTTTAAVPAQPSSTAISPKDIKSSSKKNATDLSKPSTSTSATSTSSSSSSSSRREFADKDKCLQMLETLRQHKMRGAMGKDIHTAYPFLHAVDITRYPDYAKIVSEPMDFNKIDRKLKSNRYTSLSEFSADVHLIFSNCLKYNSDPVEGADIRTMATTLRDCFIQLYQNLESGQVPGTPAIAASSSSKKNRSSSGRRDTPSDNNNDGDDTTKKRSSKKDKKEKKKKKDKKKDKKKHHHHRDKHSVEAVATATNTLSSPPIPTPSPPLPNVVVVAPPTSATPSKSSSKLSSKVKLDLSPWEASCERLVSRILKLDFVTAMHFDAPLVQKFPDLAKIYKSIVAEPMDLGTLRHLLITHAIADPVEFVRLGRLICDNAKTFNAGPDAASVRVRETADHLRWLFDSLCVELNVLPDAEPLRRQWRTDRFSAVQTLKFTESKPNKECVKVLRALMSQKQVKDRWPFMEPAGVLFKDLPPTYYEIVKQPMDLKTVGEKLNALVYKSYGEFIGDIRLTFENAMLYNQLDKAKDEWTVYNAAKRLHELTTELWGDVTIDIVERLRRQVMEHKEAKIESDKSRAVEKARTATDDAARVKDYHAKLEQQKKDEAEAEVRAANERAAARDKAAKDARLAQMDKLSKAERKIEDKRRKREEELAHVERRNRTAVVATEEALKEAELRSRMRAKARQRDEAKKMSLVSNGDGDGHDSESKGKHGAMRMMAMMHPVDKPRKRRGGDGSADGATKFWKLKRRKLNVASVFVQSADEVQDQPE